MFCWHERDDERKAHPKAVRTEGMVGFICQSCAKPDLQWAKDRVRRVLEAGGLKLIVDSRKEPD